MNRIANVINNIGKGKLKFLPDTEFYKYVGIRRKRWGQLYRNEKPVNLDELTSIARYFGVPINELIEEETSNA